ncbi:MAG: hypothetical protein GKS05_04810 [Nitrospirales bacterium]|nr:hypothetical protein [Nitrospirales bacterium]
MQSRRGLTIKPSAPLAVGFVDNRSEAIAQRKLAEAMNENPQATAQRALSTAIHNSPSMVAQRKQLSCMFGKAAQLKGAAEEELLQGKFGLIQRQGGREEEDPLQGKFETVRQQGSEKPVIQKFDAGIGAGWHIHYGEHVKYDSNNATRVNFGGRTRRQVGYAWEQVIQSNGLAGTKGDADFIACKTWIRNHI